MTVKSLDIIKKYYYLPLSKPNIVNIKYIILKYNINLDKFVNKDKLKEYNKLKEYIYKKKAIYKKKISELFFSSVEKNYMDYNNLHSSLETKYSNILEVINKCNKYENDLNMKIQVLLEYMFQVLMYLKSTCNQKLKLSLLQMEE